MATPDELLPAVLSAPDDDLPRLVYADALEETGEPSNIARAEFIRVQIELARTPGRLNLVAREAALLANYGPKWLAPLLKKGELLEHQSTHGRFRRGFIEIVWMPATWFIRRAERLLALSPVRELRVLRMSSADFGELLAQPALSYLATLDISDRRIGDRGIGFLLRSPSLGFLKCLRLRACNLTDRGALQFALGFSGRRLKEFDIGLNYLSSRTVEILRDRFGTDVVRYDPPPPIGSIPAPPG